MLTSVPDSNINIQMNYWGAEMTNMDVTRPLFDYFEVRELSFDRIFYLSLPI